MGTCDKEGHENEESLRQHESAIAAELKKAKPRDTVLLPLMRSTYAERRTFILNEASSVQDNYIRKVPSTVPPSCCKCIVIHIHIHTL